MVTFYGYNKCQTCRKAKAYLKGQGVSLREVDITQTPPSTLLFKTLLRSGAYQLSELFNRSGELYRTMRIKDRLPGMSEAQGVALLARHGRLVKRPIVTDGKRHTVGFDPARLKSVWG